MKFRQSAFAATGISVFLPEAYGNPQGYYELCTNGRKVDDHALSPAVSDYSKRNLYVTDEVTDYLVAGKNVVAIEKGTFKLQVSVPAGTIATVFLPGRNGVDAPRFALVRGGPIGRRCPFAAATVDSGHCGRGIQPLQVSGHRNRGSSPAARNRRSSPLR